MEAVRVDYESRGVRFYYVYKALAHPEQNGYVRPYTLQERLAHVKEARRTLGSGFTWICDAIDNPIKHALGNAPNSEFVIDGEPQAASLFDMIRASYKAAPEGVLSAYRDNASVVEGPLATRLAVDAKRTYRLNEEPVHLYWTHVLRGIGCYAPRAIPLRLKITPRHDMVFGLRLSSVIRRRGCLNRAITVYLCASD